MVVRLNMRQIKERIDEICYELIEADEDRAETLESELSQLENVLERLEYENGESASE